MDLRLLRNFCAVAEQENLTKAAARLRITQPALSLQMRGLEKEIGVALLRKAGRNIELTEAGRLFAHEAQAILSASQRAVEQTRRAAGNSSRLLTIGYVPTVEFEIFPKVAPLLRKELPHVRPSFRIMRTAELADALRSGEVDVSFLRLPADLRGLNYTTVLNERYILMLPDKHRLAMEQKVRIKSLSGEPYIFFQRQVQPFFYDTIANLFHDSGADLNVVCEADNILSVSNFVAMGMGISIHREYVAEMKWNGVAYRRFSPTLSPSEIVIAFDEAKAPDVARAFVEIVLKICS